MNLMIQGDEVQLFCDDRMLNTCNIYFSVIGSHIWSGIIRIRDDVTLELDRQSNMAKTDAIWKLRILLACVESLGLESSAAAMLDLKVRQEQEILRLGLLDIPFDAQPNAIKILGLVF